MKKLLCLTIVVAIVAPAMAWTPYENQTLVFGNTGAGIRANGGDHAPKGELGPYSRESWEYALLRFDNLTGADGTTTGITYPDANTITSAKLWLTSGYIETMSPGGDWGATPDSNAYSQLMIVETPWEAGNVNEMYSNQSSQIGWGDGTQLFNASTTTSPDLTFHSDFVVDNPRAGIGGPLPTQTSPADVNIPATINDRYMASIDITDLFKDWLTGARDNNGVSLLTNSWYEGGDPNNTRRGSIQCNWFVGTSQLGGNPPDPNGWINYYEDPGYWYWWGPPVISVIQGEPNAPEPAPHAGDVDKDGDVDIFDFMDLQGNYGSTSGKVWTDGDIDPYDGNSLAASGDGDVDIFDFMEIQANWQWGVGGGVPEPATISLLSLGGLALLRRRRHL